MVEIKLQTSLLLAWKDCALRWSPWSGSNLLYWTHFSFSFLFCFNREIYSGKLRLHRLYFLFQVQPQQARFWPVGQGVQVPLHLAGGTERTCSAVLSWRCCTLPLGTCWCSVCTNGQGQKPVAAGGGPWFQEQGCWDCWKGQEESEGGGEVRADKALNHFTFFATQLGIKHTRFHLAESFFPNPAFL